MRVITGSARGRKLKTLEGLEVRPTSDRVKEAVFSMVQFALEGATVLDLFAGCGQLGLEALSRGAKYAFFIDASKESCNITRENLQSTRLDKNARVANMDAADFLKSAKTKYTFDLAFLDPPYETGMLMKVLPMLEPLMLPMGEVICEHELGLELPENIGGLTLAKRYSYGKIAVSRYVKSSGEASKEE